MRLKVTKNQDETLLSLLSQLCELYNMALQQRRDVWKSHHLGIGYYDQQKQLTELRTGVEEYAAFPAAIQRDPLRRLDGAFQAFFRRLKCGEKPGFPRFRAHARYDSFNVPKGCFTFSGGTLKLIRLGTFRTKTKCKIKGEPLEIRCTYDPATRGGNTPDGRKVKGTIHWLSATHAVEAEARLYDHLFNKQNPDDVPAGVLWTDAFRANTVNPIFYLSNLSKGASYYLTVDYLVPEIQ